MRTEKKGAGSRETWHGGAGCALLTFEGLAKLKPIGGEHTSHMAGNAPGANDGACAIVVAPAVWAEREHQTPLARVLSFGAVADDFAALATVPAKAAVQAPRKGPQGPWRRRPLGDQRAFAPVVLNPMRILDADERKVNVNGGAIAIGHPIGASGARIVGTLVHELRRRGDGIGCATICSGGGQGDAIVLEVYGP
jgi:acetyl-CoA C-acetyltransferase